MRNILFKHFYYRLSTYQNLLCAFFAAVIFSLRWINCLPFSGYMPVINDADNLGFWTKYMFYAKESFCFPIGLIKGLSFPFHIANISNASIPLLAILFKLLSKIYGPFAEFYYFSLAEIVSVFVSAYFTCLLLNLFKVKLFWIKLLGVVLVALSHPLLFRSSCYYGVSFTVAYFPVYLALAYFFIRLYKDPCWKSMLMFSVVFPIAALIDPYVLFGVLFLGITGASLKILEAFLTGNKFNYIRIRFFVVGVFIGVTLSLLCLLVLGQQGYLEVSPYISPLDRRYNIRDRFGDGYGGGLGGGLHGADMVSIFIPPKDTENVSLGKKCGPSSYLTNIGFPITTGDLQRGQYEGFAYLGTIPIVILFILIIASAFSIIKNYRIYFIKRRLNLISKLVMDYEFISIAAVIGISVFLLYVMSWGYIIHIGGVRFNDIPTPSLLLALIWPKFMFARSLGRFAIPFALYVTIGTIVWFNKFISSYIYRLDRIGKAFVASIIILLILGHIYEVRGYLLPPEKVTYGNDVANTFGDEDKELIRKILHNKRALLVVPALRENVEWSKTCYAMAFYANVPLSGATVGCGIRPEHGMQFNFDIKSISAGKIKEIVNRYGDVAIATTSDMAKEILKKADTAMQYHKLQHPDVVILTLNKG